MPDYFKDEAPTTQSTADEAYYDRNQAVMAFARLAEAQGWTVGIAEDPDAPQWPVLYVDTPEGQVSWHLPKDGITGKFDRYKGEWDGHTTAAKRKRMYELIRYGDFADES